MGCRGKKGTKELSDHWSVWDWIKYNIRAHAINFSKRNSKERNEEGKTLQEELSKAKEELEMTPNDLNTSRYQAAQQKLATFYMYEEKSKGIIIQVHVRWHECGGKSTKCFLNL